MNFLKISTFKRVSSFLYLSSCLHNTFIQLIITFIVISRKTGVTPAHVRGRGAPMEVVVNALTHSRPMWKAVGHPKDV